MSSVSVIIPCYNREQFIREAIQSALRQEGDLEVIVVDDGSTDDSWGILQSFGSQITAKRIANGGVSHARNVGLEIAKGDFIQFLDSDDLLVMGSLDDQVAFAEEMKDECIVVGRTTEFSEGNHNFRLDRYNFNGLNVGAVIGVLEVVSSVLSCWLCLYPRDLLIKSAGFREDIRVAEDYELNSRLSRGGAKFVYSGINVIRTRYHSGERLSKMFQDDDHKMLLSLMKECSEFISGEGDRVLSSRSQFRLAKWAWSMGRSAARDKQYPSARAYFEFAKTMHTPYKLGGSRTANTLYRVIDPISSERILEVGKSIRKLVRSFST